MGRYWKLSLSLLFISATACNRASTVQVTSITIPASTLSRIKASIPSGYSPCFGVNITGGSISNSGGGSCSPALGISNGYVPEGQDINVSIPGGQTINIDLYVYLIVTGGSCPTMASPLPPAQLANTYLSGSSGPVQVGQNALTVDMTMAFPSQNIFASSNMPASCLPTSPGTAPSPFNISTGVVYGATDGAGHKLSARIAHANKKAMTTANGYMFTFR